MDTPQGEKVYDADEIDADEPADDDGQLEPGEVI
jgi:hypothetical protein